MECELNALGVGFPAPLRGVWLASEAGKAGALESSNDVTPPSTPGSPKAFLQWLGTFLAFL